MVELKGRWVLQACLETVEATVPKRTRALITCQLARLKPLERRVLEAASCLGSEFSAAVIAFALGQAVFAVERTLTALGLWQRLLQPAGDTRISERRAYTRYRFVHALYQRVLYEQIPPAGRVHLHHRIGVKLEADCGGAQMTHIISVLALHFDRGQDFTRAVHYLEQAAHTAQRRYANHEAVGYLSRALSLVDRLSPGDRFRPTLTLLRARGRMFGARWRIWPALRKTFSSSSISPEHMRRVKSRPVVCLILPWCLPGSIGAAARRRWIKPAPLPHALSILP